ncbi:MAG: hypothetical protein ABSB74_04240 [Tepidisphaeraceae bacterium]
MAKRSAAYTAELLNLLTDLLRQLRARIRKSPPLFVVEIKNDFSPHPDFLQILMTGIAGPNRAYVRLGSGPEIGDIIAFADDLPAINKGIAALREVTPAIFKLIDLLRSANKSPRRRGGAASPVKMSPDQQLTMVAPLVCTLVEIAKKNHPRSRSLPKIIAGPIVYHPLGQGRLEFPTGTKLPRDMTNPELWQQIETNLNRNQPVMRLLEIPVLQAAASVAKQMRDSLKATKPRPV